MEIIIVWIIFSLLVGAIGAERTIGFGSAFLIALLLSPLLGFIIVLFYPSRKHRDQQIQLLQQTVQNTSPSVDKIQAMHDRLAKLEEMKTKSLVTQKEYDKLRAEILAS